MSEHEPICIGEKVCGRCGKTKNVLEFGADSRNLDGLQGCCRHCCCKANHNTPSQRRRRRRAQERARLVYQGEHFGIELS